MAVSLKTRKLGMALAPLSGEQLDHFGKYAMTNDIDLHVGKRLRRRRRLLGLTQQTLAEEVGIRFQQIQKYECGANRVSAARLFELSEALSVPIQYFYEGLGSNDPLTGDIDPDIIAPDVLSRKETMDLVRAYYAMDDAPRKHLLDLAKSLEQAAKPKLRLVAQ
jgi:transcriptional regulator with XRE-family HTH domain